MWWRRRKQPEEVDPEHRDDGTQVWLRRPSGIEAITGQFHEAGPVVGDEPGQIYPDEIDPDWADSGTDPETSEDADEPSPSEPADH
jgi:hypothetical protein